jgi:hypothetical protein
MCAGLLATGCAGGLHRKGDGQLSVVGSYGHPIRGWAIYPAGDGRAENYGVTVGYDHFLDDRLALLSAVTPFRRYNQSDGNVTAGEFQLGFRYYFYEFDVAQTPVGLFGEILGGLQLSSKSVPEEGSHMNFTQDTGVGFEAHLTDTIRWITGYRLKHLSNGSIFGTTNPAQNDHHVYTGIAIELR